MTEPELRQLGTGIGTALAKLHTVPLGYITRFGTRVASWKQALTDGFSPDWDHIAPNGLFDEALVARLALALKKRGILNSPAQEILPQLNE